MPDSIWLHTSKEYLVVLQSRKRRDSAFLQVISNLAEDQRFGLIVSKKVAGAVGRNKIKRQLRAIIRNNLDDIPKSWIIIKAKPPSVDLNYWQLQEQFFSLLIGPAAQ
jgi:ribonuclease P protein component